MRSWFSFTHRAAGKSSTCLDSNRLVGDPIDVVTGANTDVTVDFSLPGEIPLHWRRYYNSALNDAARGFGWGHAHEYDHSLERDLDGFHYTDPLGGAVEFPELLEDGDEAARDGMLLRRLGADYYSIEQEGEPDMEFEFAPGKAKAPLARLRDDATIEFRYAPPPRATNGAASATPPPANQLVEIIDSQRRSIRVATDPAGRIAGLYLSDPTAPSRERPLMVYQYDAAGNLIAGRDTYNNIIRFVWDPQRRMLKRTDRRGYSFHFAYDALGRCEHSRADDGVFEVFLDYQPDVKATFVRRGDGGVWTYFYDDLGTITQINDPYGNATKFTIDEEGNVVEEIDPNGNVTQLIYNDLGEQKARITPLGHVLALRDLEPEPDDSLAFDLPATALEWEYGQLVDPELITTPQRDDPLLSQFRGAVLNAFLGNTDTYDASIDPTLLSQTPPGPLQEDLFGRPVLRQWPGSAERWRYDVNGNLSDYHDSEGKLWRFQYGSFNLLQQEVDPLNHAARYAYSAQERITKVVDPGGTTHEFSYDLKDRLVEIRYQGQLQETYRYDAADNLVEKRDQAGHALVRWDVGPGNVVLAWHLAGGDTHEFQHDESGRIIVATTPRGAVTCAFSDDGRLVLDQFDGQGVVHVIDRYSITKTIYFDAFEVTYDTADEGEYVVVDPAGAEHRLTISPNGLLLRQLANGTRELAWFDALGACRRKATIPRGNDVPWLRNYFYSPEGSLLQQSDSQSGTVVYRYDAAERIAEAKPAVGTSQPYLFDAAGNLLQQATMHGVHVVPGNQVARANGAAFTYDARGNLISRQSGNRTVHYRYNELDWLVAVEMDGNTWTATYDAFARRTTKTWQGRTTRYYWDNFRLASEVRHDGTVRLYIYFDQVALVPFMFVEYAALDADPASGRRYYLFTNQVGAPLRVEDDGGRSVWDARLEPYGAAQINPRSSIEMPLRFPGHYFDPETGLHYNRFRYYSPELGRYLQQDPLGIEGGLNLYAYVDNPLIDVDLVGLARSRRGCKNKPGSRRSGTANTPPQGKSPHKPPPKKPNERVPAGGTNASRRMVDKMIRDKKIVIQGDKAYKNAVKQDLYRIASSNTGNKTLTTIKNSPHPVTVKNWDPHSPGNACATPGGPSSTPGVGAPSTVYYNPHETRPPGSPADAGLNHELGHAAHNATGNNKRGEPSPKPGYPHKEEYDNINNEDNGYRRERGLPERTGHNHLP